jgi:DNA-binding transcriptional LysR family regulator
MDRAARLTELWSWLPAFRAVAETQHLPTAAAALHVSPSALSRSVSLLEQAIGQPLFERVGRRLRLVRAGEILLAATRDAMRRVDDGIAAITSSPADRLRVAVPAPWLELVVWPAAATLDVAQLDVVELRPGDEVGALLRGDIDLAVGAAPTSDDRVMIERLGTARRAVCLLARGERDRPFAVAGDDGWPAEHPRRIGMRATRPDAAIEACVSGHYRAVLPIALARRHRLKTVRTPAIAGIEIYASYRRPLGEAARDPFVEAIRTIAHRVLAA